ncbi:glycosyltransferase family 2 protein [Arenimonas aestuarii]
MTKAHPLVSIGVPVFNEAAHIDEALASLRSQDYPNLEIIICDNASTDETLAICRRHAAEDARIRIDVAPANRGVTANFRRAADLASGEFFMWASGHDLWTPGLVSECVDLLIAHPSASLAHASTEWIGPDGLPYPRRSGWSDTRGMAPAARFFTVFWGSMNPVLGVMRLDRLRECGPLPATVGGDLLLLSALSLSGDFLHARNGSWSRRELRSESHYGAKLSRYTSHGFGVSRSWISRRLPLLGLPVALAGIIVRARLGWLDKVLVLASLPTLLLLRYVVGRRPT